jgi:uncharacterized membrane protein
MGQIAAGLGEAFAGLRVAMADPAIMSVFVSMLLVVAGFGAFLLAWKGSSETLFVPIQIAYLVSGGLSGFALVLAGAGIMYIQMSRHIDAREDYAWSIVLDRALGLLASVKGRGALRALPSKDDFAG